MVSSYDTLADYMRTNFQMMYHYGFRLEELEGMMPFERDVYIIMLVEQRKEEERKKKTQNA